MHNEAPHAFGVRKRTGRQMRHIETQAKQKQEHGRARARARARALSGAGAWAQCSWRLTSKAMSDQSSSSPPYFASKMVPKLETQMCLARVRVRLRATVRARARVRGAGVPQCVPSFCSATISRQASCRAARLGPMECSKYRSMYSVPILRSASPTLSRTPG